MDATKKNHCKSWLSNATDGNKFFHKNKKCHSTANLHKIYGNDSIQHFFLLGSLYPNNIVYDVFLCITFPATVREGDLGRNLGVDAIGGQIPLIQFVPAQFFVGIFLKTMAEDNYFEGTRVFHG